jgi:hypothetical protein
MLETFAKCEVPGQHCLDGVSQWPSHDRSESQTTAAIASGTKRVTYRSTVATNRRLPTLQTSVPSHVEQLCTEGEGIQTNNMSMPAEEDDSFHDKMSAH